MMSRDYSCELRGNWPHSKGAKKPKTPMKITESIPYIWIHSQRPLLQLILLSSNVREYKISSRKAFKSTAILTCGKAASKWFRLSLIIQGENSNSILSKGCQTFQSMG